MVKEKFMDVLFFEKRTVPECPLGFRRAFSYRFNDDELPIRFVYLLEKKKKRNEYKSADKVKMRWQVTSRSIEGKEEKNFIPFSFSLSFC